MLSSGIVLGQSNIQPLSDKHRHIADIIEIDQNTAITLRYSPITRKIWLAKKTGKILKTVHVIKKNANPELVGSADLIRFTSRKAFRPPGAIYFGLTFSERSMRGSGSGQCGAGIEEYFVSYKFTPPNDIHELFRLLIGSCLDGKYLDTGDGNDNDYSVSSEENVSTFRWLTFPGTEMYIVGRYLFIENSIEYMKIPRENSSSEK